MVATQVSRSADVRARLDHPIIDSDGHADPLRPDLLDYVREVGGGDMAARFESALASDPTLEVPWRWNQASLEERVDAGVRRGAWWFFPTRSTLDRATSKLPKLMYERMDEMGL